MPYDIQWGPEPCLDSSYWPHEQPSYKVLIEGGCFKLEQRYSFAFSKFRPAVCCEHCKFCVYVEDWNQECSPHHGNPWGAHVQKSPQCPLVIPYLADLEERLKLIETERQEAEQARIAKERAEAFACRRCPAKFPSNTKLHQHIQNHHQKSQKPAANESAMPSPPSPITPSEPAMPTPNEPAETTPTAASAPMTPPSTPKSEPATMPTPPATPPAPSEPALLLTPPVSHPESTSDTSLPITPPATPKQPPQDPATPRKPISWAEIASRPVIAPKPSRLPVLTPKIIPKALETASVTCPPTPPPTPPQKPVPKHQHQKPYLTIDDLFEMFAEKRPKSGLLHTRKTESSPKVSRQPKITSYFRPAANQSTSISQGSKTPNPRSLNQLMPAEMSRAKSTPPTKSVSEKSAVLPYKTPTFSRLHTSEISSVSPYKMPGISRFQPGAAICKSSVHLPVSPTIRASSLSHDCRICRGTFGSNNGLHRHLRAIHFDQAPRHGPGKLQERGRNIMARRSLTP
ncbi:hypothetical protein G7Y79_00003g008440 [Physcia stellaris]|nr:hypothetical protein G7Y79_00003g008440 [Physcia stellaris]